MTVGEVLSAICKYAGDDSDYLLMVRDIYSIEVNGNSVVIYCTDSNTGIITIVVDE